MARSQLVLQASEPLHFDQTIRHPPEIEELRRFLSPDDHRELRQLHQDSRAQVWGVLPGEGPNVTQWKKIRGGDLVCMTEKDQVIFWGDVTFKARSKSLAENLWGRESDGQTWEYLYFMSNPSFSQIPFDVIRRLLEYREGYVVRGLVVPNTEPQTRLREQLPEEFPDIRSGLDEIVNRGFVSAKKELGEVSRKLDHAHTPEEIAALLERFEKESPSQTPGKKRRLAYAISRNTKVARLIKERANYVCELCGREGFPKRGGGIYAEVHHVDELGQGGLDVPSNMICVCPLCHRRIHYGLAT